MVKGMAEGGLPSQLPPLRMCRDNRYVRAAPSPRDALWMHCTCRFKELRGNTLRNNDAKSLQTRKAKLIEQVEADGGSADE